MSVVQKSLVLALVVVVLAAAQVCASPFDATFAGDGTYYGTKDQRAFGHCSLFRYGHGQLYSGTPLAINAPQYTGTAVCGLCVEFRGTGGGAGGNPIASQWQPGFICDECPECKHGDIDLQVNGDGRWSVEWRAIECPGVGTLRYGYEGGNPWYKKIQVAGARVPIAKMEVMRGGAWQELIKTIDNHHELHATEPEVWTNGGCARVRVTSILGDSVEDSLCCKQGTCAGKAQLPCRTSNCAGALSVASSAPSTSGGASQGDNSNKRLAAGTRG